MLIQKKIVRINRQERIGYVALSRLEVSFTKCIKSTVKAEHRTVPYMPDIS